MGRKRGRVERGEVTRERWMSATTELAGDKAARRRRRLCSGVVAMDCRNGWVRERCGDAGENRMNGRGETREWEKWRLFFGMTREILIGAFFFGMPQVLSRLELMSSKIAPHSGCKHYDSSMVSGL